jgi:hypothetical protein
MEYFEFAISEGFGTLVSHGVGWQMPPTYQGSDMVYRGITKAEFEAFGPNRVPPNMEVPIQ